MTQVLIVLKEVFAKIFSSKIFWYAIVAILVYVFVIKKLFNLNSKPDVVSYIPESQLPDASAEFKKWAKEVGEPMANKLGVYLKSWHITNITLDAYLAEVRKYTDNQLIYLVNQYQQNYYSQGLGTLAKDLADVTYFTPAYIYRDELVLRINKLTNKLY